MVLGRVVTAIPPPVSYFVVPVVGAPSKIVAKGALYNSTDALIEINASDFLLTSSYANTVRTIWWGGSDLSTFVATTYATNDVIALRAIVKDSAGTAHNCILPLVALD